MTSARFVVFEGGDGTGKSTQAARFAATVRARSLEVCETFEPGATPAGAVIRELLLHGPSAVDPVAEALLMAADRAQHVAEVVRPALDRGEWVVCDRYLPSSLVYQGVVRGLGIDAVRAMNAAATSATTPDLVVVLDVPDAVARARRGGSPDRLEAEGDEFHRAVSVAYRTLASEEGWALVDATGDAATVATRVLALLEPLLAG